MAPRHSSRRQSESGKSRSVHCPEIKQWRGSSRNCRLPDFRLLCKFCNTLVATSDRDRDTIFRNGVRDHAAMKAVKAFPGLAVLAVVLLLGTATDSAFARGRGGHSGHRHSGGSRVAVGAILAAPAFWYFPVPVLARPVVVEPTAPLVYIERSDAQAASGQSTGEWWYYCADTKAYYPYVKECAQEWQPVAATPLMEPATK
jgi:hypothetical protein